MPYHGYTYIGLLDNRLSRFLWRKVFCVRGWHLWDESLGDARHYLSCDACGVAVALGVEPPEGGIPNNDHKN